LRFPAVTDPSKHPWNTVTRHLRGAVPADTYEQWLVHLRPVGLDGTRLLVTAPDHVRAWVVQRYSRILHAAAVEALGADATIEVVGSVSQREGGPAEPAPDEPRLNPKYAFEQFVIGDSNRLAHAAALAVAELPGHAYNPLFIYGPPGVGKTHLLHSIGAYISAYGGGLTVRYTTVEAFTNEFTAAVRGGGDISAFKLRFRHNDVLLIDDIQFLESKAKTEEEFFHTFNALYEIGSQIVVTSDRMPRDLDALHARLRERFEAGLVTDIAPPDLQVRLAVLRKRAQYDDITLTDTAGVLDVIAQRITTNIRALEGALVRIVAYASLNGRTADPELAADVLDRLYPPQHDGSNPVARGTITVQSIQSLVAEAFSLSTEDLLRDDRSARVVWPRQLAMFLAREHTGETYPALGRAFGGRNHTTVMNACRKAQDRIASDPEVSQTVRRLTERLSNPGADRDA
jgi:chromosomal replication initiator protein